MIIQIKPATIVGTATPRVIQLDDDRMRGINVEDL